MFDSPETADYKAPQREREPESQCSQEQNRNYYFYSVIPLFP